MASGSSSFWEMVPWTTPGPPQLPVGVEGYPASAHLPRMLWEGPCRLRCCMLSPARGSPEGNTPSDPDGSRAAGGTLSATAEQLTEKIT